jgi:hypothetical protein
MRDLSGGSMTREVRIEAMSRLDSTRVTKVNALGDANAR